jgi:site-specific DNA recombinase
MSKQSTSQAIPAVVYLRVSGKSQVKGEGFPRQREATRSFADAQGFTIVGEYREEGVSGTTEMEDRPALKELIAYLLGNGCRTVIVESLDRLAREYRIQEQLVIYLSSKGISLWAANTGEDITTAIQSDPMKKALIQMQGIFAELDKSQLVRKLHKSRETIRLRSGRCEGQKPFGTLPGEQDTLRRMKELYRKPRHGIRRSLKDITTTLNAEGRSTRNGKPWARGTVWTILRRLSIR